MRVIARNRLVSFWTAHPAAKPSLTHWYGVAVAARWRTTLDVVAVFPKAKSLNGERVRFQVAGGDYRLITAFEFRRGIVFIKFLGTHSEYDRIDALTVNLF